MSQRPRFGVKYKISNSFNLTSSECMVSENVNCCGDWLHCLVEMRQWDWLGVVNNIDFLNSTVKILFQCFSGNETG